MKIAYLILAHTDPCMLHRLIGSLWVEGHTWFYVHVDKKTDIRPFLPVGNEDWADSCCFLQKRIKVWWGGFSQCKSMWLLLETALKSEEHFDRFVLLSGLDYPLWSNGRMLKLYEQYPERQFIMGYDLTEVKSPKKIPNRVIKYNYWDYIMPCITFYKRLRRASCTNHAIEAQNPSPSTPNPMAKNISQEHRLWLKSLLQSFPLRKKSYVQLDEGGIHVYGGAQWFNLSRGCVESIYQEYSKHPQYKHYFKTAMAPDELLFNTLIFNSPYRDTAYLYSPIGEYPGLEKTTYTHYIVYRGGMKVFQAEDFDSLMASNKMFCRKVTTDQSSVLLDLIDKKRSEDEQQS